MSLFSRLFGRTPNTSPDPAPPVEHAGYRIYAEPASDGGKWRIGARIEREVEGETKSHLLIRADTLNDEQDAKEASIAKARVMIDQQGDGIFQ